MNFTYFFNFSFEIYSLSKILHIVVMHLCGRGRVGSIGSQGKSSLLGGSNHFGEV